MPGQLDELDYRKNPLGLGTQSAPGVKHQGKHKVADKQIKSASATLAKGGIDAQGNEVIESKALDTLRALIGKEFAKFIKNKKKFTKIRPLKQVIEYFAQKVYNLNAMRTYKWKDENGQEQTKDIPEEKKSIFDQDAGKTYSIKEVAKELCDIIISYEKKFKYITWEVKDKRWKGIDKNKLGWWAQTLDKLAPIAGIKRQMTERQEFTWGYILAVDNKSDIANNEIILWVKKESEKVDPNSQQEFFSMLRTVVGDLKKHPSNRYTREGKEGKLPLKFEGLDADGFPIFGKPLLSKEVYKASNEELLKLIGHYEIIKLIENWEDALKGEPNSDPRYLKYKIKRFYARKANPDSSGRNIKVEPQKPDSFYK
jgi:hypothetical protein